MKRNESILVYGVTGLLVVILVVAVVFGEEATPALAGGGDPSTAAVDLEQVLDFNPVQALEGAGDPEGENAAPESGDVDGDGPPVGGETGDDGTVVDDGVIISPDGFAGVQAPPSAEQNAQLAETSERQREAALTRRVGDFREVTVRPGDTFSALVLRWCGSLDHLGMAEALNEDLDYDRMPTGRVVLLPWVDDQQLLALRVDHRVAGTKLDPDTGQSYRLQAGDNLWKIALQKTGTDRAAAGYVRRILDLNPGIVPEKLREGQEIRLPQN